MMQTDCTPRYFMGIDIGSTTAKVVVLGSAKESLFSAYRRHNAEPLLTLQDILGEALQSLGEVEVGLLVTGSAGMGISEKFDLPFIQEVVASAEVVHQCYPQVGTLVDIGGEDAKMIFFQSDGRPDIRMNGSCAGGTGAFIDEMATLLHVSVSDLNDLANKHTTIYPMASRCGVFAKTDLQNLLSRDVPKEDIAASVFHAVVLQTLATLARGCQPAPLMLFSGGPLTFLPALRQAFMKVLAVESPEVLPVDRGELLPATGAALAHSAARRAYKLADLIAHLSVPSVRDQDHRNRLPGLFSNAAEFQAWFSNRTRSYIERRPIGDLSGGEHLFLGVDSGSTTTKIVLMDRQGKLVFDYYNNNLGNPIQAALDGLRQAYRQFRQHGVTPLITRSVVTGYGEDLIRAAFGFDEGIVETLAHFRAASAFDDQVSFILDIGGQDMKAIFVKDGHIQNIEINEACSSGCGSFIETFAGSMGYSVADFAQKACEAQTPCDLGTRCTVFMNSRVKQALREGADIQDISAGLAYSVIKNALHKVLKVTNTDVLGEHIVVQGGTFRNPAVQRAMELLLGQQVTCPDIAPLMGAYGAALAARDSAIRQPEIHSFTLADLEQVLHYQKQLIRCRGCENQCAVTKIVFPNGNVFYSGNRCEKIFTNGGRSQYQGINLPAIKYKLLFGRDMSPEPAASMTIGIPRVLNLFENFPFWHALLVACGIQVQLSSPSNSTVFQKGTAHIMSENLCYPAKLVSGHIMDLIEKGVDRIFFPMVFYEEKNFEDAANSFNCPVVSGYADVIRSVIDPQKNHQIPLDMPAVNLDNQRLLKKVCKTYLSGLGVPGKVINRAFEVARQAQQEYKAEVRARAESILEEARAAGRPVVLLLGRPYHIDPAINHKIPEILTAFGVDVITEDAVPLEPGQTLENRHVMTQWEYINRYYHAARWAREQEQVEVVQLNSFGCGPDPFIMEEVRTLLGEYGKNLTIIRIDEIESAGSTRLRLRSMMETMRQKSAARERIYQPRKINRIYQNQDRARTLIVPDFSPFCSPPIVRPFMDMGYKIVSLPPADRASVDVGLKYTHNEICYPGIITIGDLVKALQSGKYDLSRTAIGFSQTGGQCRASSYPSMIKKALVAAGFAQVPVVTLSTNLQVLNDQPGFEFDVKEYMYKAVLGMMFTDALSDMYFSTAAKEARKNQAREVADGYLKDFWMGKIPLKRDALLDSLSRAVEDFNAIQVVDGRVPKVGIVGEIYVKYNAFSNNFVADWLMGQEIEVVMPTFLEFFAGGLVSIDQSVRTHIQQPSLLWALSLLGKKLVRNFQDKFDSIMQHYRFYHPHQDIADIARLAREIVSLNHQYGESWLIAGEIAAFVRDGIQNVLCLQPFGCIANHVIAKGAQKRMKELYPQLNLLFLDADAGVSEVNFYNRMHFFINHAKQSM